MAHLEFIRSLCVKHDIPFESVGLQPDGGLRAAEGKRNSAADQETIQNQHDLAHTMHDQSVQLGTACPTELKAAACSCNGTNLSARQMPLEDPYAIGIAKLRAARGIDPETVDILSPDLDAHYEVRGRSASGYAIAFADRAVRTGIPTKYTERPVEEVEWLRPVEHSLMALSSSERLAAPPDPYCAENVARRDRQLH